MINDLSKVYFEDIHDASKKLIEVLPQKSIQEDDWQIISISSQGIPIAQAIAQKFSINYDVLFCEPIFAPNNEECIIAMVSESEEIVLNANLVKSFGINLDFIYAQAHRQYEEKILPKVYKYRKGDLIGSLSKKNILMIDEGCETGLTAMVAAKTIIKQGSKSVSYATPILATDVANSLEPMIDEIFSVNKVVNFVNVEFYYKIFKELNTDCVLDIISSSEYYSPLQKRGEN